MNSTALHAETLEKDKIPFLLKCVYGFGAIVNNLLAAAIGGMVIVLNLGLSMNPALVGLLGALPRLTDAITDPLMGYISDRTRSRWGRRRPYIFCGAILTGIFFIILWQLPEGQSESFYFWYFLIGSLIFYLAYTMFATPWVALGYELTPDYHERTRLMATQNFMGQLAYLVSPWFLWFMQHEALFDNMLEGAGYLAMIIGAFTIGVGILPAIFLKEPQASLFEKQSKALNQVEPPMSSIKDFFKGFAITISFKPFLALCIATFLVFNGFIMVASFQSYVIIYYVFAGNQSLGAEYAGWAGTVLGLSAFVVILVTAKLSSLYGKRKAFFITIGIATFGYCLKWFCYDPNNPALLLLPVPLYAFGLGSLFTLVGSMVADVCDADELNTGQRREGMYGSIFWWVVKLGQAVALAAGGVLLNVTGFDVDLGSAQSDDALMLMRVFDAFVPAVCSFIAILVIAKYPITEESAAETRQQLEVRRGSINVADELG
ncbi:MFS transporter [Alteromonas flava]|uniref:MFS transporter n=1 Tax=Alteromonas flava TaxID=2048003 RepID=UPI000C28CBD1|nr:MFS transporter [Alteromonas flava]